MAKKIEIKKSPAPAAKGPNPFEKKTDKNANNTNFAFGKDNYMFILAGVGVLVIGYLLMVGGGADTPNEFHNDEIFSTRRITVAPITLLIGFGIVLYGIMKKPKTQE